MALDGTIVLMPAPVNPPQIPTTSSVGRSHLHAHVSSKEIPEQISVFEIPQYAGNSIMHILPVQ